MSTHSHTHTPSRPRTRDDVGDELRARTHAAALSVEMRSPLAQIELAASQLAREALTPIARAHADQIFDAVAQIDELLDRSLRVLLPQAPCGTQSCSLTPVLGDLRARFEPVLAACGVRWVSESGSSGPVHGDPNVFRSHVCSLLRFVLVACEGGGRVEVALRPDVVLRLSIALDEPLAADGFGRAQREFKALRARMLESGVKLGGELGVRASLVELTMPWSETAEAISPEGASRTPGQADKHLITDQEKACPGS